MKCKHIIVVEYVIERPRNPDGTTTVTKTVRRTYSQSWPVYNAAQTNEKDTFMAVLRDLCQGVPEPAPARTGRPRLPMMEDQEKTIAAAPAIMAAIGAMGHELRAMDSANARETRRAALIERLKTVNWTRERHWEGIAGKFTPKGTLSIGGSKETAHAVYDALNEPDSAAYVTVRGVQG